MKTISIYFILLFSVLFYSCSSDDDNESRWNTKWTVSTLNAVDMSIINTDTIFSGIQSTSEQNAMSIINSSTSYKITTVDAKGNSLILKEEKQANGDNKYRKVIVYTSNPNVLMQESFTYDKVN